MPSKNHSAEEAAPKNTNIKEKISRSKEVKEPKDAHKDTHEAKHAKERSPKEQPTNPSWERVLLARHVERPHALDFIKALCQDFIEVHGDRKLADDPTIVAGPARFAGRTVMVVGTQKGRNTKENIFRNFGTPKPEGYRKAMRLFKHAEKFGMPIITFIDTPGAFPGKESEERSMAIAIAENLMLLARLRVPVIAVVTGEGGSGGALAIGLADRILMLENAIYSVASPEASAAILWRDAAQAPAAAAAMKITAPDILSFGIADELIPEPTGGAHIDPSTLYASLREVLAKHLNDLDSNYFSKGEAGVEKMLEVRYNKYRRIGQWHELNELNSLAADSDLQELASADLAIATN